MSYMPRITRSVEMINFIFYNVHSELLDKAVKRYTVGFVKIFSMSNIS